jgi:hypothetical protein
VAVAEMEVGDDVARLVLTREAEEDNVVRLFVVSLVEIWLAEKNVIEVTPAMIDDELVLLAGSESVVRLVALVNVELKGYE